LGDFGFDGIIGLIRRPSTFATIYVDRLQITLPRAAKKVKKLRGRKFRMN